MYPLPILPLFPVKHRVLIFGQHLRLRRHFRLPPLNQLRRLPHLSHHSGCRSTIDINRPVPSLSLNWSLCLLLL